MSRNTRSRWPVARGMALLACATSGAAQAQEAQSSSDELETVTITGTNIRGVEPVGNPVLALDAVDIQESGKPTLADFLRELPANFAGGVATADNVQGSQDASSAGSNLTGGQGVNLRGLGALSTLVLVNGRRVAAAGQFGDFVDLSNIPLSSIERMEVLLDGASAVYGSDAVGGVVNVILKRRGDGAATSLRFGSTTQGGGQQLQLGQTWGTSWRSGGLLLGYEFNRQERVEASEREIYNGADFSDRGGLNWRRAANRASPAANLFSGGAAGNGNVVYTVPGGAGTGLTAASLTRVTDGVGATYDAWDNIDILPRMQRNSVFASFEQDVGERTSIFGDARFTRREGDYNQGYPVLYGTVPNTSPYFIPGVVNNFGVLIDDVGLKREVEVDSYALNLGLDFEFGRDWRGEAVVSGSREDQRRQSQALRQNNIYDFVTSGALTVQAPSAIVCALSGLTSANVGSQPGGGTPAQRYCANLNYAPFNPYQTTALSQQVLNELIGYEDVQFESWLAQASFKVDGTVLDLPGGALKLASGIDYRKEHMSGALDFNWRSIADRQVPYGATERDVSAVFAETLVPIIGEGNALPLLRRLDVSAAVRHERYSGLGSYSTTNPKLGFSLEPHESLTLRGSWGTSFHAPPMRFMYTGAQPVAGGNAAFLAAGTYVAPCNTTLIRLNGLTGTPGGAGNCSFSAIVVSGGAGPDLKPEEAETWTAGFDFQPASVPSLELGVSYFNLKIDDRIVRIQGGTLPGILAQYFATGSTPYSASVLPNPSLAAVQALMADPRYIGQTTGTRTQTAQDVAMIVLATQSNLATLKMDGIDFHAEYALETRAAGTFDFFLRGTSLFSYDIKASPVSSYADQLGKYSSFGNPVKLRTQQGVRWTRGALNATLTMNYVDSYVCEAGCFVPAAGTGIPVAATTPLKIGSWTTIDLNLNYDLGGLGGVFDGMQVGLAAVNVADEKPPFVDGGTAVSDSLPDPYDVANATVIGRTLALTLSKRW